ncbi:MAG: cation:proton antiporter [Candidatus Aenigmatarchaeota archaeon]
MDVNVLLTLGILLLFAKVFGEIAERLSVASLVGEVIAGIVLGPILGWVVLNEFLSEFMILGIIFLLLMAGLEVKADDIKKNTYVASILAISGGLLSFFLGFFVGMIFFNDILTSIAIGIVLISTNNGTLFMILMKIGEFNSKIGRTIVSITIADDVVGILILSFFTMYVTQNKFSFNDAWYLFLLSIGFYLIMLTAGSKIANKLLDIFGFFRNEYILFSIPIVITFILAYVTENLGISLAVGAFLAGVAMANSKFTESIIRPKIEIISYGFLIPLFFASIGTMLVFKDLNIILIIAIVLAAILGKFIGCGMLSRFFGYTWDEIKLIGLSMMPRGNENIVFVQIILMLGVITMQVYTSIVFSMVLTVILAPILLKIFYKS